MEQREDYKERRMEDRDHNSLTGLGNRGVVLWITFIKTTYDNSLDSQISLLPLGFSLLGIQDPRITTLNQGLFFFLLLKTLGKIILKSP